MYRMQEQSQALRLERSALSSLHSYLGSGQSRGGPPR